MEKRGYVLGIDHIGSARTEAGFALLEATAYKWSYAWPEHLPIECGDAGDAAAAKGWVPRSPRERVNAQ